MLVHTGGVDELIQTGVATIGELVSGDVRVYEFDARDVGIQRVSLDALGGGSPDFNAAITRSILAGEDVPARVDAVALTAAAALYAADAAPSIREGVELARQAMRNGAALAKLGALIAFH